MNHTPINLVIAINRLYVKYAYVMLYSFLCHHPEPVSVYILHHELTPEDEATLQTLSQQFAVHISRIPCFLHPKFLKPAAGGSKPTSGLRSQIFFPLRSTVRFTWIPTLL